LIVLAFGLACAVRGDKVVSTPGGGPVVGLYRARLSAGEGRSEKFKMLLFAAPPDRIHGEVLSPVGSTLLVFDGGAGKIAITLVRERVVFAGSAGPEAIEKLIGVPVGLEALVASLLSGAVQDPGHTVVREPEGREGLPERYEIAAGGRALQLQLKRLRGLGGRAASLGTGDPPPGFDLLPLEQFEPLGD
jgi:hypothetical protein